jgi:hypothetical protein
MAFNSIKNTQLKMVVQTVRRLGKREIVGGFLDYLLTTSPSFRPVKFGFYEPIRTLIDWGTILESVKSLFSATGERALFLSKSPIPGYFEICTQRSPRAWFNGITCNWDYAKAAPHLTEAISLLEGSIQLFDADYAGMGVGGGNWAFMNTQDPEANVGSINGIRVTPISISGIRSLHGICWINVFGFKYIEFFSADVLESLPCFRREFLNGGKYFRFQVTERPEDMFTAEGQALVLEIKKQLGYPHAFQDCPKNKSDKILLPWQLLFDTPDFDFSEIQTTPNPA